MKYKETPKVVVIGAGLAGLTTAYRLHTAGVDVDLYEARNRVGGRVFTVTINGNIAELGAQNITDGGEATYINRLIDEFGLERTSSRVDLNHYFFDGKEITLVNELLKPKKFTPEALRERLDSLAKTSRNMKEVLGQVLNETDLLYKVMAVRLAAYEGGSIESLSPMYVDTLFHMLLGGICSVHQGQEEENYVDLVTIKGGNGLLPEKIAAELGSKVHLNRPLTRIKKNEDSSFTLTFDNRPEVRADILVLAIPCSVYQDIAFEESVIPLERLKAIQNVQYGTNAKIMLPFSTTPSKKTGIVNDQIASFFDAAQNILTIYCTGKSSLFSNETILNTYLQARPMIEMGFGNDCPLFETPVFANDQSFRTYNVPVGYSWPNDPYARGSYSYIASGQETSLTAIGEEHGELFKALFIPIQQSLYFVGEHTSILSEVPGTMEAACESGERIARAILTNLNFEFFSQ